MAAEDNILSWNIPNWITVTIMVAVMFTALGLVQKKMQQKVNAPAAS
jgi:Flp pilus assembly protein protease CpaA